MRPIVIGLALLLHGMAGCSDEPEEPGPTTPTSTSTGPPPLRAMAELRPIDKNGFTGAALGWANFTEVANELTIQVTIVGGGLNATAHGLHVHANGDCGGDGTTAGSKAGGHFNPDGAKHGAHAGDLGNITTNQAGYGVRTVLPNELEAQLTLRAENKYTITGRSVVVHANPDDGATDPAGNSGPRVLCGVITLV